MAVLPVVKHGDPVLTSGVEIISDVTDDVRRLAQDMIDTMRNGEIPGVGLAAPQVGEAVALIVVQPPPEYEGAQAELDGAIALLNPEVIYSSGHEVIEEGCLSCPGPTAEVERPSHVVVTGMDLEGRKVKFEVRGALARIFQHEIDHLNGKFFFDRINPLKRQLLKARIRRT